MTCSTTFGSGVGVANMTSAVDNEKGTGTAVGGGCVC
jgi:hypothetical protein